MSTTKKMPTISRKGSTVGSERLVRSTARPVRIRNQNQSAGTARMSAIVSRLRRRLRSRERPTSASAARNRPPATSLRMWSDGSMGPPLDRPHYAACAFSRYTGTYDRWIHPIGLLRSGDTVEQIAFTAVLVERPGEFAGRDAEVLDPHGLRAEVVG